MWDTTVAKIPYFPWQWARVVGGLRKEWHVDPVVEEVQVQSWRCVCRRARLLLSLIGIRRSGGSLLQRSHRVQFPSSPIVRGSTGGHWGGFKIERLYGLRAGMYMAFHLPSSMCSGGPSKPCQISFFLWGSSTCAGCQWEAGSPRWGSLQTPKHCLWECIQVQKVCCDFSIVAWVTLELGLVTRPHRISFFLWGSSTCVGCQWQVAHPAGKGGRLPNLLEP